MVNFDDLELFTDSELATCFADNFRNDVKYDHKRKRFLLWAGNYWEEDESGLIQEYIKTFSQAMLKEGKTQRNDKLYETGKKLQSAAKIKNIEYLIKRERGVALIGNEFDKDPWLLGVKNGIVDLKTGELRDGKQNDYISIVSPVEYNWKAKCPMFLEFLDKIFLGDQDLIHYVLKAFAYTLTGDTSEQVFFMCRGDGKNGKSELFKCLTKIMGRYAATVSPNAFKKNLYYTATNDIADLQGKRLVTNSESIKGMTLDEQKLKQLAGGDEFTGRRLNENNITFTPVCKIWLHTNDQPKSDDETDGFWRKVRTIPFDYKVTEEERIFDYGSILFEKEAPGILRLLVEYCPIWKKERLKLIPEAVVLANLEYKKENNPLLEYANERVIESKGNVRVFTDFYNDYKRWCTMRAKIIPTTDRMFGKRMVDLGYKKDKQSGEMCFFDIDIHSSYITSL